MNCQNHPNKRSVATCAICGKPICDECRLEIAGKDYCQKCVTEIVATEASKRNKSQETPKDNFNNGIEKKYEKYLDDLYYNEEETNNNNNNNNPNQMSLKEQLARDEEKHGSIVRKPRKPVEPTPAQEISESNFDDSNLRNIKTHDKDKKNRRSLHPHIHSEQKKKEVKEESTTAEIALTIILIFMIILVTSYIIYLFTLAHIYPNFFDAIITLFSNPAEIINNIFS
jgi:hypothetical protein